jgi:hypothetical protein
MDMKRRRFATSLGFAAGALVGPGWLSKPAGAAKGGSQASSAATARSGPTIGRAWV